MTRTGPSHLLSFLSPYFTSSPTSSAPLTTEDPPVNTQQILAFVLTGHLALVSLQPWFPSSRNGFTKGKHKVNIAGCALSSREFDTFLSYSLIYLWQYLQHVCISPVLFRITVNFQFNLYKHPSTNYDERTGMYTIASATCSLICAFLFFCFLLPAQCIYLFFTLETWILLFRIGLCCLDTKPFFLYPPASSAQPPQCLPKIKTFLARFVIYIYKPPTRVPLGSHLICIICILFCIGTI